MVPCCATASTGWWWKRRPDAGRAGGAGLLSLPSNQSHIVTLQIERARDLDSLASAAAQITKVIACCFAVARGWKLIARLVQQLNARLFERAWQLDAPPDLVANSRLFVMGSEGRGEQLAQDRPGQRPPSCARRLRTAR